MFYVCSNLNILFMHLEKPKISITSARLLIWCQANWRSLCKLSVCVIYYVICTLLGNTLYQFRPETSACKRKRLHSLGPIIWKQSSTDDQQPMIALMSVDSMRVTYIRVALQFLYHHDDTVMCELGKSVFLCSEEYAFKHTPIQ